MNFFLCRQMVARSLLDTLREVCDDEGDCVAVLERIGRLADDSGMCPHREQECVVTSNPVGEITMVREFFKIS